MDRSRWPDIRPKVSGLRMQNNNTAAQPTTNSNSHSSKTFFTMTGQNNSFMFVLYCMLCILISTKGAKAADNGRNNRRLMLQRQTSQTSRPTDEFFFEDTAQNTRRQEPGSNVNININEAIQRFWNENYEAGTLVSKNNKNKNATWKMYAIANEAKRITGLKIFNELFPNRTGTLHHKISRDTLRKVAKMMETDETSLVFQEKLFSAMKGYNFRGFPHNFDEFQKQYPSHLRWLRGPGSSKNVGKYTIPDSPNKPKLQQHLERAQSLVHDIQYEPSWYGMLTLLLNFPPNLEIGAESQLQKSANPKKNIKQRKATKLDLNVEKMKNMSITPRSTLLQELNHTLLAGQWKAAAFLLHEINQSHMEQLHIQEKELELYGIKNEQIRYLTLPKLDQWCRQQVSKGEKKLWVFYRANESDESKCIDENWETVKLTPPNSDEDSLESLTLPDNWENKNLVVPIGSTQIISKGKPVEAY